MKPPRDQSTLSLAIDRLLDCGSPHGRAGILLDAVLGSELAQAASLWRRIGSGEVRAWHPLLSRGPASSLPTLGQVEAVSAGALECELGARRLVLNPPADTDFALSLGEVDASEWQLAELEALLAVWAAIERAEELTLTDVLDAVPGPTDHAGGPEEAPDELSRLLSEALDQASLQHLMGSSSSPGYVLAEALEFELARNSRADIELDLATHATPPLALGDEGIEDLVQNLLEGQLEHAARLRVALEPARSELPGALLVIESDHGWPPSLSASPGRPTESYPGLSLAVADLHRVGGCLRLDRSPWGGLRTTCWIPAL